MPKQKTEVETAAIRLKRLSRLRPTLAVVLGSGFQSVLEAIEADAEIAYERLPGFPPVGVSGHAGRLVMGKLGGTPVMALSGRAHFYEGHAMTAVTHAVRVLAAYGIEDLVLTNAAGGVNRRFRRGDFMILTDHINFMGTNPLRGPALPRVPRFVDLSRAYDAGLAQLLRRAGRECGLHLRFGVYLAVCGPSYETPAEIAAFARLGADAVGMSTVPEAIVARQCGLRVAGLSCITNVAAGVGISPHFFRGSGRGHSGRRCRTDPGAVAGPLLSHEEVLAAGVRAGRNAGRLLERFAVLYGRRGPLQ